MRNLTAGDDGSGGCWRRYKVQQPHQNSVKEHIRLFTTRVTKWGVKRGGGREVVVFLVGGCVGWLEGCWVGRGFT